MAALKAGMKMLAGSGAARGLAVATLQSRVQETVAAATTAPSERIDWAAYNWPGPKPFALVHLDLAELEAKRPAAYPLVLQLWRWAIAVNVLLLVNFLDACILTGIIKGSAYSPLAPFFSILTWLSMGSSSFATMHRWAYGAAENSGRAKTIARVLACVLAFMFLLFVLLPSGNIQGLAGLAQGGRHAHAAAE
jgi:hypothetical protein